MTDHQTTPRSAATAKPAPDDVPRTERAGPDRRGRTTWHRRLVQDVLPFVSSLGVHAGVLGLGVMAGRAILTTLATPALEEQTHPVDGGFVATEPGVPAFGPDK